MLTSVLFLIHLEQVVTYVYMTPILADLACFLMSYTGTSDLTAFGVGISLSSDTSCKWQMS